VDGTRDLPALEQIPRRDNWAESVRVRRQIRLLPVAQMANNMVGSETDTGSVERPAKSWNSLVANWDKERDSSKVYAHKTFKQLRTQNDE
jgi:hypothetical protein